MHTDIFSRYVAIVLSVLFLAATQAAQADAPAVEPVEAQVVTQAQAQPEEDSGWKVTVEPSLWMPTTRVDLSYGDRSAGVTLAPEDLKGRFEFGATGRAEARNGPWGVAAEGFYVNLNDDVSFRKTAGSVRLNQLLVQAAGLYRVNEGEIPVDLVFGARYYDWNVNTSFTRDGRVFNQNYENRRSLTWADPVIGARASFPLGQDVRFGVYGDAGGFGLGSDFSWRAAGRFDWTVSDSVSLGFGYLALGADYRRGSGFETTSLDFSMYGPMLGASFRL